jgi:hypothetical protein
MATAVDSRFSSIDIGNPKAGSTKEITPDKDFDVVGYGTMIGHHVKSDVGRFVYKQITGDFDVTVRVQSFTSQKGSCSSPGLMARKDLTGPSMAVGVHSYNNEWPECNGTAYGCTFFRICEGYETSTDWKHQALLGVFGSWDEAPANPKAHLYRPFPNFWFRLTRIGNFYSTFVRRNSPTYASPTDAWEVVSAEKIDLGASPYVGVYITAAEHGNEPANGAVAQFRDLTGFGSAS